MSKPLRILVIDDSEDDRMLYRRVLSKSQIAQFTVTEADDGEAGLALIGDEQPDCVLLDYSMPGRDGIGILKRIRPKYPFVPVVMLTGMGNEKIAVVAMQEGAQNYISKSSITPEALEHAVLVAIQHCAMNKRIEEQRTSLEVFTRALAHDLKEPVRTIRAFCDVIASQQGAMPERTRGHFDHIRHAAERMSMLIDTVFLYTRLDGQNHMSREWCDLSGILSEVKVIAAHLIRENGATVTSDRLPEVFGNDMQLIQLMQNLVCNAALHGGKNIHVSAANNAGQWTFSVADDGPGIEASHLESIFEPFKRLHDAGQPGAGLGLSICRKIVESHGGRLWCESKPGEGTVFRFTLPGVRIKEATAPQQAVDLQPAKLREVNGSGAPKELANVLLVDDRPADIEIARFWLFEQPRLRCNVLEAHDGKQALDLLHESQKRSGTIDLILLDINMPVMDGFEMLKKLRADRELKEVKVVMCSGSTYDKDIETAKSLGAEAYLVKPVRFDMLKSAIDNIPSLQLKPEGGGYSLLRKH